MYIPKNAGELELYRQSIIRQYKAKHENKIQNKANEFLSRFKHIIPINIGIGVLASIIYISTIGGKAYFQIILGSVIWITFTSTIIGAIIKKN